MIDPFRSALISLYHLARTALDNPSRHDRMIWAATKFCMVSAKPPIGRAYKALSNALEIWL